MWSIKRTFCRVPCSATEKSLREHPWTSPHTPPPNEWAERTFCWKVPMSSLSGPGSECNLVDVAPGRDILTAGHWSPALRKGFRESFNEAALDLQGLQRKIKWPRGNGSIPPGTYVHVSKMREHWIKQMRRTLMLGPFEMITLLTWLSSDESTNHFCRNGAALLTQSHQTLSCHAFILIKIF